MWRKRSGTSSHARRPMFMSLRDLHPENATQPNEGFAPQRPFLRFAAARAAYSNLQPEMKRLRTRERFDSQARKGAASAGILDSRPRERRVEVVAAVHEARAGLDAVRDAER